MQTNSQIRQSSLAMIKGNWSAAVAVTILFILIDVICNATSSYKDNLWIPFISLAAFIFVYTPVAFGMDKMFLEFARDGRKPEPAGLIQAFNSTYYLKSIGVTILASIYILLWTLLLIVPGIIKSLSYAMTLYIVAENPEIGYNEAIERSMAMMKGYKMKLFLMQLGYLGWALLSAVTLFIGMLWIIPYYQTVFAKFYLDVKADWEAKQMQA